MRLILALGASLLLALPLGAEEAGLSEEQAQVLTCLDGMGAGTEWGQCVGLMFAPCADQDVGSEGHVACLTQLHSDWRVSMDGARTGLMAELTSTGSTELAQLMGQWFGLVAQNCSDVAVAKEPGFAEAAQLGCEISEMAGVTSEFVACHEGRSTAPYCVIQE